MRYMLREKLLAIGEDSTIRDEQGRDVYWVDNKVFSIRHEFQFKDMQGDVLAVIQRKLLALRPVWEIWRDGKQAAVVRRSFIKIFRDKFEVDVPGPDDLEITGDIFNHNYTFRRGGVDVANVSKRWISLTDTFGVDIHDGEDDVLILCSVIVIDQVADEEHREHEHD